MAREKKPISDDGSGRRKPDESTERRVKEMNLILQLASVKLEEVDQDFLASISDEQREEFFEAVANLEQQEMRLGSRCPYCRSPLTAGYGVCATCGREVCSKCGTRLSDEVSLHRGNCTVYYQGQD